MIQIDLRDISLINYPSPNSASILYDFRQGCRACYLLQDAISWPNPVVQVCSFLKLPDPKFRGSRYATQAQTSPKWVQKKLHLTLTGLAEIDRNRKWYITDYLLPTHDYVHMYICPFSPFRFRGDIIGFLMLVTVADLVFPITRFSSFAYYKIRIERSFEV